ncbi:MAG: hypothetical protein U1F57_10820 [bacterium]
MMTDLDHKRLILEKIVGAYQTEGPLPSLGELHSCISQMDPKELAQAIYLIEYNECRNSLADVTYNFQDGFKNRLYSSKGLKNDIEKIFMAVAEHFRRMPGEASETVDEIFHYFYKTLVHLSTKQGLSSHN